jgi:hypothetical protein
MPVRHPKRTRAQLERDLALARVRAAVGRFDPRQLLEQIARDESAPPLARVAAAQALIDRPERFEDTITRRAIETGGRNV